MVHIQEYVPKESRHCNPYCINNPKYKPKSNCISGRTTDSFQRTDRSSIVRDMSLVCCLSIFGHVSLATPVPLSYQTPRFNWASACPFFKSANDDYVLIEDELFTLLWWCEEIKTEEHSDWPMAPEQQDGPESPRATSITLSSHLKITPTSPFPPNQQEETQSNHRNLSPFVLSYYHIIMHVSVHYPISGIVSNWDQVRLM